MDKSPDAFRTISEVADELDVPQHVLRFWETRFNPIKPLKRGGGRRYYRRDDVELLKGIRHLLYGEGYTIRGVQRILKEEGIRFVQSVGRGEQTVAAPELGEQEDPFDTPSANGSALPGLELADSPPASAGIPSGETGGSGLGDAEIRLLQAAWAELDECRRVLSALKTLAEPNSQE
ncbi:MerR family transcriptional regulator [Microvirga pudoricolor]|uniref:MerR family transcriptional regulator n=1 Tax=Microvirga pudoricolor TaxID=2778729 RepID=UPI00194FEE9A|nr:MerR family transcriptional regulator [Microvirga pudoricolor]MBM6595535.1 MerR family transcriptional regulator [Microvirga pudoricolor]